MRCREVSSFDHDLFCIRIKLIAEKCVTNATALMTNNIGYGSVVGKPDFNDDKGVGMIGQGKLLFDLSQLSTLLIG